MKRRITPWECCFILPTLPLSPTGAPRTGTKRGRAGFRSIKSPCIKRAVCRGCEIQSLKFADGSALSVQALFTTRGDVYHNGLAKMLGAKIDRGEVSVDLCLHTAVKGLYAAGCVTPANCQMIIAAGQGATAAQSINRDLYRENLASHELRRFQNPSRQSKAATGVFRPNAQ